MILFWITAAAMLLLALTFALTPMLRSKPAAGVDAAALNLSVIKQQLSELESDLANGNLDRAQYEAARRDLEKELVEDVGPDGKKSAVANSRSGIWAVAVVAAGLPLLALAMYQSLGQHDIIARLQAHQTPQTAGTSGAMPHADQSGKPLPPMEELVKGLAAKLEENPDNLDGWMMLARSYLALDQAEAALAAYDRAYKLAPQNPEVLLAYAQTLVRTGREGLNGRPGDLVATAYRQAPNDPTALWMMGLLSFERQEFAQTVGYWEKLASQLPQDSEQAQQLADYIGQARSRMAPGEAQAAAIPPAATRTAQRSMPTNTPEASNDDVGTATAGASKATLKVSVSLDPSLADQVQPGDRVFVFARAVSGPPMPLAAVSREARELPVQLTLDDSMAMMPQMKLSAFPQVLVGARVSKSGSATPQSGDLQGEVSPVEPGRAEVVRVVIDSVRP